MITLSHKIELKPNNKQKTYFRKAFGCARLAYNWGLAEWQRMYKEGEKCSAFTLITRFNAIKGEEFPFVYEVTKFATEVAFRDLEKAFEMFFKKVSKFPRFKKKKDCRGGFAIAGDKATVGSVNTNSKFTRRLAKKREMTHQYVNIPNLGRVKMSEKLRFEGKVTQVRITQHNDKFYATFFVTMTEEEYYHTHPHARGKRNGSVGIDLGLKSALITSDGMGIDNPKFEYKDERRKKRLQRQLSKRIHPKNKEERIRGVKKSNNYRKLQRKVNAMSRRIASRRHDFIHKTTSILTTTYREIGLETLNVDGMRKNHRIARSVSDVSFGEIVHQIEYKSALNGGKVTRADKWFASSKTCSQCGNKKDKAPLHMRIYRCDCCGMVMDRDVNAAINLKRIIGVGSPKLTPVDLTALQCRFSKNGIATSKVETGKSA